ncbi:hypothetical protein [Bradyrhizobium sp. ERR14]|uniref:hypothetical protein n=1 Tax=Bradyrhizobium sp. ERR14 TaxID=2663837 RepID=UPI00289AB891|nr:hypothetical protein [Bradyrhizobium sp. ERR14]
MKALLRMVVDRSAQCLKVAAGSSVATAVLGVSRTSLGVDLRQHLAAPILVETLDPGFNLVLLAGLANVGQVN